MENEIKCELMCRACLSTGRLYSIYDYKLSELYRELTGSEVNPQDGLPQHLCTICSTLLAKHAAFKKTCLRSLALLEDVKNKQDDITAKSITEELKLSTKRYSLSSTLITQYPPTNFDADITIGNRDGPFQYHSDTKPIKSEVEMYIDNFSMKIDENSTDSCSSQLYIDEVMVNEDNNLEDADTPKIDEVKSDSVDFAITDNKEEKARNSKNFYKKLEETEVVDKKDKKSRKVSKKRDVTDKKEKAKKHKTKKPKNDEETPTKKIKKTKIEATEDDKMKNNEVDLESDDKPETEVKKEKFNKSSKINKYRGKFFETTENMSGFESLYEVEVIILTKEQQHSDVLERKTSHNYLNSPFRCQFCFKGFIDEDNLNKHYKSQHDPSRGTVACEFCQFRYRDKRGLNQHLKTHRLKFICRQCKYVSRTTYNAKEHYKMHRGMMHDCKQCGKAYEKLSTYLTHMRVHHPDELAWCDLCGEPFVGQFGLNGHKKKAHRDLKFPSDCKCPCGVHFTNQDALHHHSTLGCSCTHPCVHCGAGFHSGVQLKQHLHLEHRELREKQYDCAKCSKTFKSESLYSGHYRRTHADFKRTNVSPWVCEMCGKILPNKSRLVYHQRVHTGERPYKCMQCPKSFTMSKLLRSHSRVHSNERPFTCKLCPKAFKGPSALRAHECIHSGTKKNIRSSLIIRNGETTTV